MGQTHVVRGDVDDRPWLRQDRWRVRFEWGPSGVEAVQADVVVVVDVCRFTTAVDAAVGQGAVVFPYRWRDGSARAFADQMSAELADSSDSLGMSLSPVSLLRLGPGDRVVLPSPNGSTCAVVAAERGATVVAACLRNATAVARYLDTLDGSVLVIGCGERWEDETLRPAVEDYLGAGAVIAQLRGTMSPEAELCGTTWESNRPALSRVVAGCVSGRELAMRGWQADLDYALAVDASESVPVMIDGAFRHAETSL